MCSYSENKTQASTVVSFERDGRYIFITQLSSIKTAKKNILGRKVIMKKDSSLSARLESTQILQTSSTEKERKRAFQSGISQGIQR